MIAFDSPAGAQLRRLELSRAALAALWFTALTEDRPLWAAWAQDRMTDTYPGTASTLALQMLQAAQEDNIPRARRIWLLLASLPLDQAECRILQSAQDIGRAYLQGPAP